MKEKANSEDRPMKKKIEVCEWERERETPTVTMVTIFNAF